MKALSIRIFPEVSQKYIIAKISNSSQTLLWGNPNIEWHKDIKVEMEQSGFLVEEVRGGGKIRISVEAKIIYVWGKSGVYGEVSFLEVKRILEAVYPDHSILNEIPPGE